MDKFLQNDGIESGYWDKRKNQFNDEIAKGLKAVTGQKSVVQAKPKNKKAPNPKKPNDIMSKKPSELAGQDFVERMRLAKEAKAKEREEKQSA